MKKNKKKKQPKVLSDHAKIGKRFVPPFTHMLGNLKETPWVDVTLPELVWIACLNHEWGFAKGAALAVALSAAAREAAMESTDWFASVSSYKTLTEVQRAAVVESLEKTSHLSELRCGLLDLQVLYPEAPFRFLYGRNVPELNDQPGTLSRFKAMFAGLFDKTTRAAIFAQGNVLYLGFVAGKLRVAKGTSLAEFPALEDYPKTERSRMVAAAVRSATPMMLLDPSAPHESAWAEYFWNRGLELEQCKSDSQDEHESSET